MTSRSSVAALALVLCLGLLSLDQCSCQAVPQTVVLGGASGWSNISNVNYTMWMIAVPFKAGDTLRFNNTGAQDQSVLQVYSQEDYNACNSSNNPGWTVNPGDFYDIMFPDPVYRAWVIDPVACLSGLKVEFAVLNADGTPVAPDTGADPPSLNAPPASDYVQPPPAPPAPPMSVAGGPTPNAAASTTASMNWFAMIVIFACSFAISRF